MWRSKGMAWECSACGAHVDLPVLCPGCGALVFCSTSHATWYAKHVHDEEECARMRQNMSKGKELEENGLAYAAELAASRTPSSSHACSQLEHLGLHHGVFQSLCSCQVSKSAVEQLRHQGPGTTWHCALMRLDYQMPQSGCVERVRLHGSPLISSPSFRDGCRDR